VENEALFAESFDVRLGFFKIARALAERLRAAPPDAVLVVEGVWYYALAQSALRRAGRLLKTVAVEHMHAGHGGRFSFAGWSRRAALKHADALVVLTSQTREAYAQKHPPKGRLACIPHALEDSAFLQSPYNAASRRILSAGRFTRQKGFDQIAPIAQKLFARHADWTWDIYGDGPARPAVEAQIRAAGLSSRVRLCGEVPDLTPFLKDAALFALPSRWEGFGMVLLEAMAAGVPCVAFDCPSGPRELLEDPRSLAPCFDQEAFARALAALVESPEARRELSQKGRLRARRYALEEVARRWEELLFSL
jgi:glycosyltransferase involved in cell wall biosynthesis